MRKRTLAVFAALTVMTAALGVSGVSAEEAGSEVSTETAAAEETSEAEDAAAEETSEAEDAAAEETAAEGTSEDAEAASDDVLTIRVGGAPSAPPTFPVLHMIEDNLLGDDIQIELDIWESPEQLIAMVQDGNHDMFAFPLNVASKLYNKGLGVELTNINTWGVTYLLTTDESFETWADLEGKTLYVPLQSAPPDIMAQYFITQAGLTPGEDVELVYVSSAQEIAPLLVSGEAEYAICIEPAVSAALAKSSDIRRALSFSEEWQKVMDTDSLIPNAGFGGMKSFYEEHPEEAAAFEAAYEESVQWINDNPAEAGALAEKYLGLDAQVVEQAIPYMELSYLSAVDATDVLNEFYQVLYDFDPETVGGSVPDEGLYYAWPE